MKNEFDLDQEQIEEQLEWISSINSDLMDTKGLILSSKIARTIANTTGKKIALSGGQLLVNLGRAVLEQNDKELNKQYFELVKMVSSKFDSKNSTVSDVTDTNSTENKRLHIQS